MTLKQANKFFSYDAITGNLLWNYSRGSAKKHSVVGGRDHQGYITVGLWGKRYKAHRIIWLMHYGYMPEMLDHINGIPYDNRLINLRAVDNRINQQNQKRHREGKLVGATYHKAMRKWVSRITINKKLFTLGYYTTAEEAHKAYLDICSSPTQLRETIINARYNKN